MSDFAAAMNHGEITEVFPDVFMVTGTMRGEFFGSMWQFSRNMTVVREDGQLTLINAVRLNDAGLTALDALGKVKHVTRLGAMHGVDDAFYIDRYGASYWGTKGVPQGDGPKLDHELTSTSALPFGNSSLFQFQTTKLPESILRLDREGGILIACDSLQNWVEPDEFFLEDTISKMKEMGFFMPANLGPAWMHVSEPKAEDFVRLKEITFKHALCGHGAPLRDTAQKDFHATFARVFDV